jgi:acetylornithine/LysW-gamma-L-lysine aminotransferase
MSSNEVMTALKVGEHTSTFGGNPLVCAAAAAAVDALIEEKLADRAAEHGSYFMEKLKLLKSTSKIAREVRGLGLMIGLELRFDILNILNRLMENAVLVLDAGRNVLRFLPPLVIEKEQIDEVICAVDNALKEEENGRLPSSAID